MLIEVSTAELPFQDGKNKLRFLWFQKGKELLQETLLRGYGDDPGAL